MKTKKYFLQFNLVIETPREAERVLNFIKSYGKVSDPTLFFEINENGEIVG